VDLVYIDPPFNSNRNYEVFWGDTQERRAFEDRFGDAEAYCTWMFPRVVEIHRVLKPTGSFYYHCDWHASHYIKVKILDEIFGFNNFRTEIIWRRTNAKGLAFRSFPNNHDSILFYSKGSDFTFNRPYSPHNEKYVEQFYKYVEPATGRRYALDNLANPNKDRPNLTYEFLGVKRVWRWTKERMQDAYDEGLIVQPKPGAVPRLKRYLDEQEGIPVDSIWSDILPVQAQSAERLGYPTQKPLALLERIVKASSNPGDIVLDPFCGCGTALVAAQKLGRRWIGIDIAPSACNVMGERLERDCGLKRRRDFIIEDLPETEAHLRKLPPFEFQNWCVIALSRGIPGSTSVVSAKMSGDLGIDGKVYLVDNVSLVAGKKSKKLAKPMVAGATQDLAFDPLADYIPVQVKQKDKAGRPEIDEFFAAVKRDKRHRGFFVAFSFSGDAKRECDRLWLEEKVSIQLVTVKQLIEKDFRKELEYVRMVGR
jgi:site-specific DNA-methyltransferase (adenine-specific)